MHGGCKQRLPCSGANEVETLEAEPGRQPCRLGDPQEEAQAALAQEAAASGSPLCHVLKTEAYSPYDTVSCQDTRVPSIRIQVVVPIVATISTPTSFALPLCSWPLEGKRRRPAVNSWVLGFKTKQNKLHFCAMKLSF